MRLIRRTRVKCVYQLRTCPLQLLSFETRSRNSDPDVTFYSIWKRKKEKNSMVDVVTFLSSLPSRTFSIFFRKEREAPAEFVTLYRLVGASEQVAILLARQKKRAAALRLQTDEQISLRKAHNNIRQILQEAHLPENMATVGISTSVITALEQGDKITAIKAYRDEKHVSLREAKEAIEFLQENMAPADMPTSVIAALETDGKIAAIKAYQDEKHVSLREAKEAIEHLQEK
jgi:ribosomal protein L7/L12